MTPLQYLSIAILTAGFLIALRAYMISQERNEKENDELNNLNNKK